MLDPLVHIINLIFVTGKVPSSFKISIVIPVCKKGCKTNITNYRPISIISTFANIFAKCFKKRLIDYLSSNNILNNNQFGFMKGISTNDAMFKFIHNKKIV